MTSLDLYWMWVKSLFEIFRATRRSLPSTGATVLGPWRERALRCGNTVKTQKMVEEGRQYARCWMISGVSPPPVPPSAVCMMTTIAGCSSAMGLYRFFARFSTTSLLSIALAARPGLPPAPLDMPLATEEREIFWSWGMFLKNPSLVGSVLVSTMKVRGLSEVARMALARHWYLSTTSYSSTLSTPSDSMREPPPPIPTRTMDGCSESSTHSDVKPISPHLQTLPLQQRHGLYYYFCR